MEILENGEIATFENGQLEPTRTKVGHGDVLVDGSMIGDINEYVLKDRELLAQEGLVLISVLIDVRQKKIISGPEVVCKGLIVSESLEEVIEKLKDLVTKEIENGFSKRYIDWNKLKNDIRDSASNLLFKTTKKNPIIMPAIIDIEE